MAETAEANFGPDNYPDLAEGGYYYGAQIGQDLAPWGLPGTVVGEPFVDNRGFSYDWKTGQFFEPAPVDAGNKSDLSLPITIPETVFGPVTASGYAQPPVDPLSYYSTPEPTPEPTPYTGGPTRWTEINRPALDLSNIQTFTPVSSPAPEPTSPPVSQQPTYSSEGEDSGTSLITDENRERYIREGGMNLQGPSEPTPVNPLPETSLPKVEDVNTNIFSGVVTNPVQGGEKPYYIEDTGVAGPAIESKPITPGLIPLDKPQFTLQPTTSFPSTTTRNPIVLPGASVLSRPVITTPLPELPVNPVLTRNRDMAPSRYFRDINYDPEEILAAAMRSMGGRMARRSILNELS
jgi:hypothetical protein